MPGPSDLASEHTKSELRDIAKRAGLSVPRGARKADVAEIAAAGQNARHIVNYRELMNLERSDYVILDGRVYHVYEFMYDRKSVRIARVAADGTLRVNWALGDFGIFDGDENIGHENSLRVARRPRG